MESINPLGLLIDVNVENYMIHNQQKEIFVMLTQKEQFLD